jgi:hypothetical protein
MEKPVYSVRLLNTLCHNASEGRCDYVRVKPSTPSDRCVPVQPVRIIKARTYKGQTEGQVLATGQWTPIETDRLY